MARPDDETEILDRVARDTYTADDLDRLRDLITVRGNRNMIQVGRYNVRLNEGRNIHVGDRIYRGMNAEAIRDVLTTVVDDIGNVGEIRRGSLRGFSGFVMTVGILMALGGMGAFAFGLLSDFGSDTPTDPPAIVVVGFGIGFAGAMVYALGQVIRGWERSRHVR